MADQLIDMGEITSMPSGRLLFMHANDVAKAFSLITERASAVYEPIDLERFTVTPNLVALRSSDSAYYFGAGELILLAQNKIGAMMFDGDFITSGVNALNDAIKKSHELGISEDEIAAGIKKSQSIETPHKAFETDAIISLITQRAIPDGRECVGALLNYVCSLDELPFFVSSKPFAPVSRGFLKEKFPVFNNINEQTLDAQLEAEGKKGEISYDRANEIVTGWLKQERTRLNLGETTEVPPISPVDGIFFQIVKAGKESIRQRASQNTPTPT